MKSPEGNNLPHAEALKLVWEGAKKIRVCMMTTWDGRKQCARPMSSHVYRDQHAIYFLDRHDSAKEQQIKEYPEICLNYMDQVGNTYIAISGRAVVSNDRSLIKKCWSAFYKAWWDSENDPNIRVIIFKPEEAEIWNGDNQILASGKMLLAAVTGAKPSLGDNAKVAI